MSNAQVGAASLDDGQIELMVHRRLVDDDNCGLAQELDETEIVDFHGARHGAGLITRGTNRLTLEPRKSAHRVWRPLADRAYARPLVAFARATRQGSDGAQALSETTPLANFSALFTPLPEHVQLLTLQELRPGRLLLRLAHQLAIGEDATLAQPAQVNPNPSPSPSPSPSPDPDPNPNPNFNQVRRWLQCRAHRQAISRRAERHE